jgi:protein TonB
MDRAHALTPHLSLDGKRIAATSIAISLHVAVLMLLMMPAQSPPSRTIDEDTSMIVVPKHIEKKEPKPIPVIPLKKPQPRTAVTEPRIATPVVEPVDQTAAAIDPYVERMDETTIVDNFPPQSPVFAQIRADIAPPPPYPASALRRHITGEVTLRVLVDAQGRPVNAVIESSSGSKLLDEAALKFVLARWHFIPATQDGQSIEAYALVPINFVIDN